MAYLLSDTEIWFPKPDMADDEGLLAVGGDLSAERLLLAYHHGIFPWYSDETPVLWYSPDPRFVLLPGNLKISKSMRKLMKNAEFRITHNQAFARVIQSCAATPRAGQPGTWITDDMQNAYINLHRLGYAHSVEVWQDELLVGGLYGVAINRVFCGESMFSKVSNASKVALIRLCQNGNYGMIDCQVYTAHLESLGASFISREAYLGFLQAEE